MRGAKDCEDKVKDSMGTDASKVDMNKAQSAFEECLTKCADTNVAYIPTVCYSISPSILPTVDLLRSKSVSKVR